jgi:hypothetical protein
MKTIKQIIREEIDDFDWVRNIEPTAEDIIKFIRENSDETVWRFGKHWEGDLDLRGTHIEDLGDLESVSGHLCLDETPIRNLGNLKTVGGYLFLGNTKIQSLQNLEEVGGDLDIFGNSCSNDFVLFFIKSQHGVT